MDINESHFDRRRFIKDTVASSVSLVMLSALPNQVLAKSESLAADFQEYNQGLSSRSAAIAQIKFSVIGLNHGHIYSQVEAVTEGGGQLVSFYAKEPELVAAFAKRYPGARLARNQQEILEDKSIQLILSAAIPDERAPLGIQVMLHGKDFMVDKPGITSLQQLTDVRKVQKETGRIYSINTERFESQSLVKAGDLVKAGAIGKVIQTVGLGPHQMNPSKRPEWFFDPQRFGGIICDIGSHQFDQYLFFTGTTKVEVVAAHIGNMNNPQYPQFQDFGDVVLHGNGGMGYLRVDWFSPDGLKTWGDGRLNILGTDGYIEIRKNIDIAGRAGKNHLFLVNQKEKRYIDCSEVTLPYGQQLVYDVLNRTETAMSQEYCFMVAELGLVAQQKAQKISLKKS